MAIQFEFYESPDPTGEGAEKYHARTVTINTVDSDKIAEEIQEASTLTVADIRAVLSALSNRISYHLRNSERVHLQGIGYFHTTLQTSQEVDPKKTKAQSVAFKSVAFRADRELKESLRHTRMERSTLKIHSAKLTSAQVDSRVAAHFEKSDHISRRELQMLCGMTSTTASRHLRRLVDEGKVKNVSISRFHPIYVRGEL